MKMADLEKGDRPHGGSPAHLDDEPSSSRSEQMQDPLDLPSLAPPLEAIQDGKLPAELAPPNGGLCAWLHVLGSFFLFFNSW
jgi:hypothetical protein